MWQILNCLNIITNLFDVWLDKMRTLKRYFMKEVYVILHICIVHNFKQFWRKSSIDRCVFKKLYKFFLPLNVDTRFWQKIIKLDHTKKMLLASSCSIFISWWIKILPSLAKRLAKNSVYIWIEIYEKSVEIAKIWLNWTYQIRF